MGYYNQNRNYENGVAYGEYIFDADEKRAMRFAADKRDYEEKMEAYRQRCIANEFAKTRRRGWSEYGDAPF